MISQNGFSGPLKLNRFPIASWPGKNFFTKVSFTIATRFSFFSSCSLKSRPNSLSRLQAADNESGADEKHERKRDLNNHERIAQARAPETSHRHFVFQRRHQLRFRRLHGR